MDYKEKMRILIERPELLGYGPDEGINSNCFGNVAWIHNFERQVAENWIKERGENPFSRHCGLGNYIVFAPQNRRPGYIGHDMMELFLEKKTKKIKRDSAKPGDIWTLKYSCNNTELCGFVLRHTGILNEDGTLFEKTSVLSSGRLRTDKTPKEVIEDLSRYCKEITQGYYTFESQDSN